ncbi:putative nuclease HARBI1 [Prorops nasuta]|uniref:putative nuclease HARBI1 n=1 Tax=Prorops nasuta TaxID=863751 RepID=UPI0034CE31A5
MCEEVSDIVIIACSLISNELNSDSSESEESDTEILLNYLKNERVPRAHCKNYIEEVVWMYTDTDFKSHFRLSRHTFRFLMELLTNSLTNEIGKCGRPTISAEKTLLIAVWLLATPNSFRCVADRFGVGKGTAWRCVRKVVNALYSHVHSFITWPTSEEAKQTSDYVFSKYGFPNTIGAIDGTHIKIAAPKTNPESYINRKGYTSIQLQVICNHELKFIHCYSGQVGSVHDMRVFRLSQIPNMCCPDKFPGDTHLIGDAAYAIQKYLMVPFKDNGHLSEEQVHFNKCLSRARMMIERSIGLLKGRFRSILDTLPMKRTDIVPKYIMACCILHNICLLKNDTLEENIIVINEQAEQTEGVNTTERSQEGIQKRNAIMYYLRNNV